MKPIRIIGGGFSGLAAGYFLTKKGLTVEVFERNERLGGLIETVERSQGLVETAANGFMNSTLVDEVCRDLNLQVQYANRKNAARYIFRRGKPRRWPLGPVETVSCLAGLAWHGIKRNLRPDADETLNQWATKRFGAAGFNYLVAPAACGIFGDCDLSADLASKAVGVGEHRVEKEPRGLVAPKQGMGRMIKAFADFISERGGVIHLGTVGVVEPDHATIIATDASAASVLCAPVDHELARLLRTIEYIGLATVTLFFDRAENWRAFGCLFPKPEKFNSLGVMFNSDIFDGRAAARSETWILPCLGNESEESLLHKISSDRMRLPLEKAEPVDAHVKVWPRAIPKYNRQLKETLLQLKEPYRVYLHGNYLGDLGLAKILSRSSRLAERIAGEYTGF